MSVIQVQFQTVEEIYRLVWTAVRHRRSIEAIYQRRLRLFCPHRLGRNADGQLHVVCYQYGGESQSGLQPGSPANWRCLVLDKLSKVKLLGCVTNASANCRAVPKMGVGLPESAFRSWLQTTRSCC